MTRQPTWLDLLKRLWWDLRDPHERIYYGFWIIWQIPGAFGNMLRARYLRPHMKSAGSNLLVMAGCRFRSMEKLEVGDNVNIGFDNFLQAVGGLRIGNDVSLGPGVKIWTTNHEYADPDLSVEEQGHADKPVEIGNNVFIASNAFVLPGARLPDGCIVSAGAVVGGKTYRPFSILAGNPARVIGYRGDRNVPTDAADSAASPVQSDQQVHA